MGTLANSEDSDEILFNAAFHQGLHCFIRQNHSSEKEIMTCDPLIYTMDHSDFIVHVSNFMGNSICPIRVKDTTKFESDICCSSAGSYI